MYALKRIIAYIIDYALIMVTFVLIMPFLHALMPKLEESSAYFSVLGLAYGGLSMALPVVLYGIMVGLWGRTPGKFIMFLKVQTRSGQLLGIPHGILREIIKLISLWCFFCLIWALFGIVTRESAFYDEWLGFEVEDLNPWGLTETQKNWRKQMKNQ
jgi:uncharacterized RDD family membrane protein YckC